MSTKESRLLVALADELSHLELLESYGLGAAPDPSNPIYKLIEDCKTSWPAPWGGNGKDATTAMHNAVSKIVRDNLPELVATAVANQRVKVQEARDALHAFQTKPLDTPLDERVLEHDEANDFAGSISMAGAEALVGGTQTQPAAPAPALVDADDFN